MLSDVGLSRFQTTVQRPWFAILSSTQRALAALAKALSVGLSNAYFKSLGLPTLIDGC